MTERIAAVPPGVDPTDLSYPLQQPKVGGCLNRLLMIGVYVLAGYGFFALLQQTQSNSRTATTQDRVITVAPTPTLEPTSTPYVPVPGNIPTGIRTARPSPTQIPTITPVPLGAVASFTPGPWMLTRFAQTYEAKYATTNQVPVSTPGNP